MIVGTLKALKEFLPFPEDEVMDEVVKRYEKLLDDISAAAAIDGNERVLDLIEEEMEEG